MHTNVQKLHFEGCCLHDVLVYSLLLIYSSLGLKRCKAVPERANFCGKLALPRTEVSQRVSLTRDFQDTRLFLSISLLDMLKWLAALECLTNVVLSYRAL